MRHLFSHCSLPSLFFVTLATPMLPALLAQSRCPAGIASVTPRFVQHALIVIPVKINQRGPFDFIVDTGSQITVIDPTLADKLGLNPQAKVGLVSVASFVHASATVLDSLEADSKVVEKSPAIVQDLGQIQAADPRIRGVLGESFFAHFDLLVDYRHKLLCLDETRHHARSQFVASAFTSSADKVLSRKPPPMSCLLRTGWLSPPASPAPENSRFSCSSIPEAMVPSCIHEATALRSRHWSAPPLRAERTQPVLNGPLPSCRSRTCGSATISSARSRS